MIDNGLIKKMENEWAHHGFVYQGAKRSGLKLRRFENGATELIKGKNVLELACNAGLFGYLIAQYANSYIGVEPGKLIREYKHTNIDYFKQAEITRKYIENPNVRFINNTVAGFLETNTEITYDVLVVCFALYHFDDKELGLIKDIALPKCDMVIIQNRNKKREHIKNSYKLYKNKNILKYLESSGFRCTVDNFNNDKYSQIIGKRC